MIHDEDLRSSIDYSEDQKLAAHRVLVELVNLFNEYRDDIRIVGGWVPDLMFPDQNHVGSVDVDVLINHLTLNDSGYQTMAKILLRNGYKEHPEKYFSFVKTVDIDGEAFTVDVDILAGIYGGTATKKRSQHVQGIKALKATGGNFAFEFPPQQVKVEAERVDGAIDTAVVNVVAVVPFLIMKTAAMGRGKAKDAYDIYFVIKHYIGGVDSLAEEFRAVRDKQIVIDMKEKLSDKFASEKHAGPKDVSDFMDLANEEEIELIRRDAYEQVSALIEKI
ncbi:nucleotidyl transferase AbiEii/AbiGii toxin family protein [Oribacterium sp. FC2011]|uniref:nucleotidyl transferase AbiEii/AbiGii toxin family protein n=1 Tax=Oribacterium sp. FC2011 TaxID=1408311 RepID=UPI0004E0C50D|nr:nucleotidyl transferase AbiEii/AbiGii toxin family protein [Oribacterium sp. FC2011]